MIQTLIAVFLIFFIVLISKLFNEGFVRGEVFDATKLKVKPESKSEMFLNELNDGINYINSHNMTWLYITSFDGLKLAARFFNNADSKKLVILFHGYRSIAENDFATQFKMYYELGYNILLIDQRSHGRSEGRYITFGIKERYDCVYWCEYMSENYPEIEEIILNGISMGATTILLASEFNLPSKVKGIVADCGFTSPKDIISKVMISRYGMSPELLLPIVNIFCIIFGKFNIYECSVKSALSKNKLPVLFIHGTSDDFIPSKMSRENFNDCISKKKIVLVECVNHGLAFLKDKVRVSNEIKNFLAGI